MPLIARQRSRLAVLAVLALVGSLLAVSAVPAVAVDDDTADFKAMYSACVGAATEDAGFTDMGNSNAADAANCLHHYGITSGTGDGSTFSANRAVTRLQMARFLSRAAGPAGVDTMMASDQMLSDIADLSDEAQDAVNTVASLGIMEPRSDGVFDPSGIVTRADMAIHIAAFLKKALAGPEESNLLTFQSKNGFGADLGTPPFTDISRVSVDEDKAIRQIFELGVTEGTTATTFAPSDPVSRGQMALFITRALGHTNARPIGISAQGPTTGFTDDTADVSVSVREADGNGQPTPVYDAAVGVVTSTTPDEAFDDDGACVTGAGAAGKVQGDCTLTDGENTDEDGNALRTLSLSSAGTLTAWVYTGASGDKFNADTTDAAKLEIDVVLKPTKVVVTDSNTKNSTRLKFGDTVTYTIQVTDKNGDAVAKSGIEVAVSATIDDSSDAADGTAGGLRTDNRVETSSHKTDDNGLIEISFTEDDPDADNANQDEITLTLTLTLTPSGSVTEVQNKTTDQNAATADDAGTTTVIESLDAIWADEDSVASHLSISSPVSYHVVNDDGVRNVVRATLVDQYGDPVGGKTIYMWSDAAAAADGLSGTQAAPAASVETRRNGIASRSYTRTTNTPATENVDAEYCEADEYVANTGCPAAADTNSSVEIADADRAKHYWATRISNETVTGGTVVVADVDNKTVVVNEASPRLATWKAGDQFIVDDADSATVNDTATMAEFEAALSDGDTITITVGDDPDDINVFNITANT